MRKIDGYFSFPKFFTELKYPNLFKNYGPTTPDA